MIPSSVSVCNSRDEVRLNMVRGVIDFDKDNNIKYLKNLYKEWVQHDEYLVLKQTEDLPCYHKDKWFAAKCSKRGNDVYQARIEKSLKEKLKGLHFKINNARGIQKTNALYLTLTYDTKLKPKSKAWLDIGKEWNLFLLKLKKEFFEPYSCPVCERKHKTQSGFKNHLERCFSNCDNQNFYEEKIISEFQKNDEIIKEIRSWESFNNGYPHIHAVIVFKNKQFETFKWCDKEGKMTWRIKSDYKNFIQRCWHSHVDVQGVVDIDAAIKNVVWYVLKDKEELRDYKNLEKWAIKDLLTTISTWFFRKRSFSVSGGFADLIIDVCIIQTRNSAQCTLEGIKAVVLYEMLGLIPGDLCKIQSADWCKVFDERPVWIDDVRMPRISQGGLTGDWFGS